MKSADLAARSAVDWKAMGVRLRDYFADGMSVQELRQAVALYRQDQSRALARYAREGKPLPRMRVTDG